MAFQQGTATDVHNMLQLMSTFLGANGWTIDRDAVVGSGRELLVSSGESYFQMRSGTTETLSVLDVPLRASNTVETGIWLNGSTGFDNAKNWNRQPGRCGRYIDGQPIPVWMDTDGNTGSFDYKMYAWTTPTPEFYLVAEYQTGPDRYTFLSFGEMEQIHDWGFTRGVPYFTASRDSYRNTSAITDTSYGARGPFGNYGSQGTANFFVRWKPANTPEDTFLGATDTDNTTESPWASSTSSTSSNNAFGYTGRHVYGMATHLAIDMVAADPSTFNGADVLVPFYTGRQRIPSTIDGQVGVTNYNWSLIGVPNHSRFVDMTNLLPGDTLIIGGDTWQVWPNHYIGQTTSGYFGATYPTIANLGFAVRQS